MMIRRNQRKTKKDKKDKKKDKKSKESSIEDAIEYYKKASDAGDIETYKKYNELLIFGPNSGATLKKMKDKDKAKFINDAITQKGNSYAMVLYANSIIKTEPEEGAHYMQSAAQLKDPYGLFGWALCLFRGTGTSKDTKQGLKFLDLSLKKGCTTDGVTTLSDVFSRLEKNDDWDTIKMFAEVGIPYGYSNCLYYYYKSLIQSGSSDKKVIGQNARESALADNNIDYKKEFASLLDKGQYVKKDSNESTRIIKLVQNLTNSGK